MLKNDDVQLNKAVMKAKHDMAITRVISSAEPSASQPRLVPSLGYWFELHVRQQLIGCALRRI